MSDKYDELKKYVNINEKEKEKKGEKKHKNENEMIKMMDQMKKITNKMKINYEVSCFNEVHHIPHQPLDEIMDDVSCEDLDSDFIK